MPTARPARRSDVAEAVAMKSRSEPWAAAIAAEIQPAAE
jgi:hypothetical protein